MFFLNFCVVLKSLKYFDRKVIISVSAEITEIQWISMQFHWILKPYRLHQNACTHDIFSLALDPATSWWWLQIDLQGNNNTVYQNKSFMGWQEHSDRENISLCPSSSKRRGGSWAFRDREIPFSFGGRGNTRETSRWHGVIRTHARTDRAKPTNNVFFHLPPLLPRLFAGQRSLLLFPLNPKFD